MTDKSWEDAMARLAAAQRDFVNGDATGIKGLAIVGPEVACLVSLERWTYTNARDRAETKLDLRVTQAFRREEGAWRLVHRHADSLMQKHAPV